MKKGSVGELFKNTKNRGFCEGKNKHYGTRKVGNKMSTERIKLDELSFRSVGEKQELEQKFVHFEPDAGEFTFKHSGNHESTVQTQHNVGGWHLVIVGMRPYLISHSAVSFILQPKGLEGWEYYEKEAKRYLETCYSNKALGARGVYFTEEMYKFLSDRIKSSAGQYRIFLGSKRRRDIFYEIALAYGIETFYVRLADTAGGTYQDLYSFRPVVELSPKMYLCVDNEHDGSSHEKGMLLEPAQDYDPASFKIETVDTTREGMILEAMEIIKTIRSEMARVEKVLNSLK